MPSVTYNGQSFAIDGRRFWILGASIHYARLPAEVWAPRIASAREAGFNTIETACPWCLHEPRRDRFLLEGNLDVRRFVRLCAEAGMRVILRPGPFIGAGYDGGGLPAWLTHTRGMRPREGNEMFLERVNIYFRRLLGDLEDLQATRPAAGGRGGGGPILLVESEHAWLCSNPDQADRYLREITRVIRESGFTVPIINSNDLWQESPGTIDTWRGSEDLLAHLRQLRTVQPEAPRLLSAFTIAPSQTWGEPGAKPDSPEEVMVKLAECLAAGAQPIVAPFHDGTNFGFMGGRLSGGPDRFITTAGTAGGLLNEAGLRTDTYHAIKRLTTFASHFGQIFAELDSEFHPVIAELPGAMTGGSGRRTSPAPGGRGKRSAAKSAQASAAVVPLRGAAGRLVFVFGDGTVDHVNVLLEAGVRLPVAFGDQRVSWLAFDTDLHGSGRLDYCNLCPFALVDRSILVLHGAESAQVLLSINGTPFQCKVPAGRKPVVTEHKGITLVICNRSHIDSVYHDRNTVYVGVAGFDARGAAIPAAPGGGAEGVWAIARTGSMRKLPEEELSAERPLAAGGRSRAVKLGDFSAAPARGYIAGLSPRFATLDGPETLVACGAPFGYGWYSVRFNVTSAKKRLCLLPRGADRVHVYVDGEPARLYGVGRGAEPEPFELRLGRGEHVLTALVDNLGRFADGNEMTEHKGLFGHLLAVKAMRSARPKTVTARPVDPFSLRNYIAGRTHGHLSDSSQVEWIFTHARKTELIVDVNGAAPSGTFVLNDQPLEYFPGAGGACLKRITLRRDDPAAPLKRGKNVLRFAPDQRQPGAQEQISRAVCIYEAVENLTQAGTWSFAKWEPPAEKAFEAVSKTAAKSLRPTPCWWRARFTAPKQITLPLWLETAGLSKGQAFLNGQNLGRYFTATAQSKPVGPQTRLHVPTVWLRPGAENDLLLFDEHGFDPGRVRLVLSAK